MNRNQTGKGPARKPNGHAPACTYRVVWHVSGQGDAVNHLVLATDAQQARRISLARMRIAVGENFGRWKLDAVV